jgi:hypothetical protein
MSTLVQLLRAGNLSLFAPKGATGTAMRTPSVTSRRFPRVRGNEWQGKFAAEK